MFSRLVKKNRTEPIVYGICGVATVKCKKQKQKKEEIIRERKEENNIILGSLCCVFKFVSFGTRTRCVLDIKEPKQNLMLSIKENKNKRTT